MMDQGLMGSPSRLRTGSHGDPKGMDSPRCYRPQDEGDPKVLENLR